MAMFVQIAFGRKARERGLAKIAKGTPKSPAITPFSLQVKTL